MATAAWQVVSMVGDDSLLNWGIRWRVIVVASGCKRGDVGYPCSRGEDEPTINCLTRHFVD